MISKWDKHLSSLHERTCKGWVCSDMKGMFKYNLPSELMVVLHSPRKHWPHTHAPSAALHWMESWDLKIDPIWSYMSMKGIISALDIGRKLRECRLYRLPLVHQQIMPRKNYRASHNRLDRNATLWLPDFYRRECVSFNNGETWFRVCLDIWHLKQDHNKRSDCAKPQASISNPPWQYIENNRNPWSFAWPPSDHWVTWGQPATTTSAQALQAIF